MVGPAWARLRRRLKSLSVLLPIALAGLELSHPAWSDGAVSQAVAEAVGWWIPLHVLLIGGYALLTVTLWRSLPGTRVGAVAGALLMAFGVCNTLYVAVDGIVVGVQATTDPTAADALWNGPSVALLADLTGLTWSAALLSFAAAHSPVRAGAGLLLGLGLIWLSFVVGAVVPGAALVSRSVALAVGAWSVYATGASSVPWAMLVFAAVLRQHVGAEAALGLILLAVGAGLTGRSAPGVASRPSAG